MKTIVEKANAIFMYLYLQYYVYRLRNNTRFMIKEAIEHGTYLKEK